MSDQRLVNERYELKRMPIARGGMGEVWEGRDTRLDRPVAVKFLRFPEGTHDDELVRRFVRESRITARLQHPGVPAVFDAGTHDGKPFLVMQRIHGSSVSDLVAGYGPLPIGWAAAIAAQTCAVLMVAHHESLIHRDLKPGNLILEPDGTVKVLDFGLAVALDLADMSQITRSGQTIGTPAYMAPEQVLAAMSGPRSDLYTLGCTLHQMLTGRQVFTGSTAYAVMNQQVDAPATPVRQLRSDVPSGLARLLGEMLEKKPEDRPESAQVVYQRLQPFLLERGPLPGVLNPPSIPSSVRMYAAVVGDTFESTGQRQDVDILPEKPAREGHDVDMLPGEGSGSASREGIEQARGQASSLVKQARYSQAAEVLETTIATAGNDFGTTDPDVVNLRLEWANVLFEGGEYRRAAPVYQDLVADLATRDGADTELVFRCRLQNATCHALIGDTSVALRTMEELLADESRVFGPDDSRTTELRRQIGLLQLGAGQRDAARQTLSGVLEDLIRLHGPDHPPAHRTRELLQEIPAEGGQR